jgi:hypothetical protein
MDQALRANHFAHYDSVSGELCLCLPCIANSDALRSNIAASTLILRDCVALQYKHIWHAAMKPPPDWGVSTVINMRLLNFALVTVLCCQRKRYCFFLIRCSLASLIDTERLLRLLSEPYV